MAEESSSINSPPDECESPAPSSTSVSLATVVEEMTEAIETLKNTTGHLSAVSDNTVILDTKVYDPYFTYETKSQRLYLGDHLAKIGAAQVFTSNIAWLREMEHGGLSEDVWPYLQCLYNCCGNYTNYSQKFAEELGKAKIIPILVQNLHEFKETYTTDEKCEVIVQASLCSLYNMSMMSPTTRPLFREINAVESLTPYLKADIEKYKTFATLTLAYVIDEENLGIVADPSVICFIIELFTKAVDDETKMYNGYSATELAMGIERLAVNDTPRDDNKLTLVAEGVIPPLFKLMTEGDEEEKIHAILAISQLAFHPGNRDKILQHEVIPQLKKFEENKDRALKAARGALWELQDAETRIQKVYKQDAGETKKDSRVGHIMLSYQWDHQEVVIKIKNILKANGYKVWMDIEQMFGSTLEAMAGAVEDAAVVLICMSLKYKESPNCRRECKCAVKKNRDIIPLKMEKYDPDGWLGIAVEDRMYYKFSSEDNFEEAMSGLMKDIGDRGKEHTAPVTEVDTVPPKLEEPKFHDWTQDDVRAWVQENQLEGDLEKLEGKDLRFLQVMKKETPAWFYKMINDDLKLKSVPSKRKLSDALDKLK